MSKSVLSQSENSGLSKISNDDLLIYSVGISTGGNAELCMAKLNPKRHIIATTIDEEGIESVRKYISEQGFDTHIEVKYEDVSKPLAYEDGCFDFIYARLVLHYLSKESLQRALKELYRVLKPGGRLFIVVRSADCPDAHSKGAFYDEKTGLTKYVIVEENNKSKILHRYFHTEDSITTAVEQANFKVDYIEGYSEQLFADFMRTNAAAHEDHLIELMGVKDEK